MNSQLYNKDNTNFQTPLWVCKYMADSIIGNNLNILEPTPGAGNLVNELKSRGHNVRAPKDFYNEVYIEALFPKFEYVVMNPPFTPMDVGYKILYDCMELSNNIIALMPWLTIINSQKRTRTLLEFGLESITHLPRNAFPGSRVQTCILQLNNECHGDRIIKFIEKNNKMDEGRLYRVI